jgi:hypothetical protein
VRSFQTSRPCSSREIARLSTVRHDRRGFASSVWVEIMDTAGLFDQEKDLKLVISS